MHYAGARAAAEQAAGEIEVLGRRAAVVGGDLTAEHVAEDLVSGAASGLGGGVDLLIANAAVQIRQDWRRVDRDAAHRQFDANIMATIALIQAATPHMIAQGWGRIVTIGSIQQWRPHPEMLVYAVMKSGMEDMVRSLAAQLAPDGITVNNVAPGVIGTERNADALSDQTYRSRVEDKIPLGRVGCAEECAGVVAMLCAASGDYITGVDIPVDGGMRLG